MRHQNAQRRFSRTSAHRQALFRNLATSFMLNNGRIETTVPKVKDLRIVVEKLITLGAKTDLHSKRQAYSYLLNKDAVHKLFAEISPKLSGRNGGYTRITRTRVRPGDATEMAVLELVQ